MAFLPSAFKYPVFQSVVLNAGYFFLSACLQPIQKTFLVEFASSLFVYRVFLQNSCRLTLVIRSVHYSDTFG